MSDLGNKDIMAKNLQYYMELHGKSRQDMCEALGVKYTTFTDWVKGNVYPRIDKIELMANYFGINKSDLVEERKPTTTEDDELNEFIALYKSADVRMRNAARAVLESAKPDSSDPQ